jgi:hypothetical protein
MIELDRTDLLTVLTQKSAVGSLLVVGGPGTGKSWLLRKFAAEREDAGDAALLILAEEHNYVESLRDLEDSLHLTADVVATLKAYPGTRKYLIIDSLDALRAEASQRVFRQLIRLVRRELPEWSVVASIRFFDAEESLELQQLFPPEAGELDRIHARHVKVPVFTDSELEGAKQQEKRLEPVLDVASPALKEILRNAFNLWLLIHLLNEKVELDWLYEIESEVQLMDRYWHYRISKGEDRHDRVAILTQTSSEMVKTRTLSIPAQAAHPMPGASAVFQSLLSDEILRKTSTNRVAYSHNILFDFSVAKLLLDDDRLFEFLSDPERSIFYRPSVSYFLVLLWYRDRQVFWKVTARFFKSTVPLPARLQVLPGMAIFHSARLGTDLEPLLSVSDEAGVSTALSVLRAIQAFDGMGSRRSGLWLHTICELSQRLNILFFNEYLALLEIASRKETWTLDQRLNLSAASIRLLVWLWDQAKSQFSRESAQELLAIAAGRVIPVVTSFYYIDPDHVREALRHVLDRIGRRDVSPSEAYALANKLDIVIKADPDFAIDVYAKVFAHKEKSQETTRMGGGKILVLTSTRAQDYSMAYYILGVRFNLFLEVDLKRATLAAVRAIAGEVRREHLRGRRKIANYSVTFDFDGIKSRLSADRSEIWDQGYRDDVSLQLIDALLNKVPTDLKSGDLSLESAWSVFKLIAEENQFPVVWKHLLRQAAFRPELMPFAMPLLRCPEILAAPETTVIAGELIAANFKSFQANDKAKIEEAIWKIPSLRLAKIYRVPADQRDRLLTCIPEDERSARSKTAAEAAQAAAREIRNEPFFKLGSVTQRQITDEDLLREHGADTESEPNRKLLNTKPSLAAFESKFLNEIPAVIEVDAILPQLENAYEIVKTTVGADERVATNIFTSLTAVAESIAKNDKLREDSAAIKLCREILTNAAVYPHPEASDTADEHFDRPAWGPTPKIEAAQGIIHLVHNFGLDSELQNLIVKLSADKSPAVRFQIASGLGSVYLRNAKQFWQTADFMLSKEQATGVMVALARSVGHPYIAKREPTTVVEWFRKLLKRPTPKQRPEDVFGVILDSLMYLYVYLGDSGANQLLRVLEKSPVRYAGPLRIMASSASYYLTYDLDRDESDTVSGEVRARAREIENRILRAVDSGFQLLEKRSSKSPRGANRRAESVKQLLMTIDTMVFRLYILVNANPALVRQEDKPLGDTAVKTLFAESAQLWEALVSAEAGYRRPMAPSTAHHLMESFNRLLPFDPQRILRLVWYLITGRTFGYQFDQMAIHEFAVFAERILADYKELLREQRSAVQFAEILDVFANAGWPEATRLVLRMDAAVR